VALVTFGMIGETRRDSRELGADESPDEAPQAALAPFEALYDEYADFVFRSLRRLGVPDASADDALQEVFLVVHRRRAEYRGNAHVKTWLFRIAMHVARDTKRALGKARAGEDATSAPIEESGRGSPFAGPLDHALHAERVRLLYALLDELDEDKRALFILSELEQMAVKDIADALSTNLNTIYSRLRVAKRSFEEALARHRARTRNSP
jgi:RNA polymerase sigma-70 factor (ECF subfamily)